MTKILALFATLAVMAVTSGTVANAAPSPDAEVTAVVQNMAARWGAGQRHTIVDDLWDKADPQVMYLAGEQADWFVGVAPISAYLGLRPNAPASISSYAIDGIRVRAISDTVALAVWNLDYQFQRGTLPAMRERLRASAMLRRTQAGWKFFYYAESPKSAMTYLRDLYESIVTPEFKTKVDGARK